MRLIDADALMDLYANRMVLLAENYGIDSTACGTLSGAMKLLKIQPTIEPERISVSVNEVPSAQTENDWVPVTKKAHPDLPIRVQVQMNNGWIITAYYQDGEWLSVPDCGEALRDEWIEAWRELSEPYAERREE